MNKRISPYVFAGLPAKNYQKRYISGSDKQLDIKLSISTDWQIVAFYKDLECLMGIKSGDVVDFIQIGDEVFVVKTKVGYKLGRSRNGGCLRCKPRKFVRLLTVQYGLKHQLAVTVKRQKSELNGSSLFKIQFPYYMMNRKKKLSHP